MKKLLRMLQIKKFELKIKTSQNEIKLFKAIIEDLKNGR